MNTNQRKNIIYSLVLITLVIAVYLYRNSGDGVKKEMTVSGVTMGVVPYNVKYLDAQERDFQTAIDSLLEGFNESLSTYIKYSEISRFNKDSTGIALSSGFFHPVLKASEKIYQATNGAFDPTVMPLVNAWGFGPNKEPQADSASVDSLMQFVGFDLIQYSADSVKKARSGVQLDFSAVAKGYAVDLVGELLLENGVEDFMVEIGGEVVCHGRNRQGDAWLIGINNPQYMVKGGDMLTAKIRLDNKALATSGNYRNYYVKDGKKYAHTINPKTGYPVEHNLLSASVFAVSCMDADAYATAFMVVGTQQAITWLEENDGIEGFLIYDEGGETKTYCTKALEQYFVK